MLTNWNDLSQKLGIPNRKNELWRYSQVKDFVDTQLTVKEEEITRPSLPDFFKSEVIYFDGKDWVSNFKLKQHEAKSQAIFQQDGLYAWYKNKTKSFSIEITNAKEIIICLPSGNQQLLIPELTLHLNSSSNDVKIYEVQTATDENSASTIYSVNIINKINNLTYHRLSLSPHAKSISWLNIDNYKNADIYVWKQKNIKNKEIICINNLQAEANSNLKLIGNLADKSKYDLTTHINHLVEQTNSNQLFKCILDGDSQAALTGKIFIDKNCPQTKAFFRSKHTLLSPKAHVHSQPQLEIHTDDVECAHGSSTGSLQEEELFYLTSRGITPQKAKEMLLGAFINDEIMSLKNPEEQNFFQGLIL